MQELAGLGKVRCAHLSPPLFSDVKLVNYSWPEYLRMKMEGPFIKYIQTHFCFGTMSYTCIALLRKHPAEAPSNFISCFFLHPAAWQGDVMGTAKAAFYAVKVEGDWGLDDKDREELYYLLPARWCWCWCRWPGRHPSRAMIPLLFVICSCIEL